LPGKLAGGHHGSQTVELGEKKTQYFSHDLLLFGNKQLKIGTTRTTAASNVFSARAAPFGAHLFFLGSRGNAAPAGPPASSAGERFAESIGVSGADTRCSLQAAVTTVRLGRKRRRFLSSFLRHWVFRHSSFRKLA
ncbi:MAG: hypothetical protein ACC645_18315, partial [Pirellulales bacterium]